MPDKYTPVQIDNAIIRSGANFEHLTDLNACHDCGALIWNRGLHDDRCKTIDAHAILATLGTKYDHGEHEDGANLAPKPKTRRPKRTEANRT